jgi:glycosyltransferase involved in cell wall biosynthesis
MSMAREGIDWSGWHLVVVGGGDEHYVRHLKGQVTSLRHLLPEVSWMGPVWGDKRWDYLQAADLFCLPTHSENFGLAVLESLHVGTPVLTTDKTPWGEYDKYPGFIISRPEMASIGMALRRGVELVQCKWTRSDRIDLASWANERFSWDKLAPLYIEAYTRSIC